MPFCCSRCFTAAGSAPCAIAARAWDNGTLPDFVQLCGDAGSPPWNVYPYSAQARADVQRVDGRAWEALDDSGFIEEPDPDNGENGYRVPALAGGGHLKSRVTRNQAGP